MKITIKWPAKASVPTIKFDGTRMPVRIVKLPAKVARLARFFASR